MSVKDIVDLIENHREEFREIPMQLLLVKFGARKAYLLESSEYNRETVKKAVSLARSIGLRVSKDRLGLSHAPRYLIYIDGKIGRLPRTDEELGALLGFKDPGGEYGDWRKNRTTLVISEIQTGAGTTELVQGTRREIETFADRKVRSFNGVMMNLGLPYRFEYLIQEQDGSAKRAAELDRLNMKYIRENKNKYIQDLWNELNGDMDHPFILLFEDVIKKKKLLARYVPFYRYFYDLINRDNNVDNKTIMKRLNKNFGALLKTF